MEDKVPHQQGHIADRSGTTQHESYAAAQDRQALQSKDTNLGCAGAFEGSHAEDLPARGAVSAQLINQAEASGFAQGTHNVPSICRLPLTVKLCAPILASHQFRTLCARQACGAHTFVPVPICGDIASRACAAEGILLALTTSINRYGLLYPMMSSMI